MSGRAQPGRMKILLTALAALIVAAPAAAAPPPNDNRADAQQLPTFPSSAHGSTVEATTERLDPQVSKCGRVDATVWYRIDAAPDGTIVATAQAAGQLAPVVRLYRRLQSSIQEVSCSTAKAGGKAIASVAAVRGAGYLILVGRRPGAADGEFDLRADLVLPPENDERGEAARVGRLPATVRGTTLGATSDDYRDCGMSGGGVWYRFQGPATGRALVQLDTGQRSGAVAVFRRSRGSVEELGCAATDRRGGLTAGFAAKPGADYLILVGDRAGSSPGAFVLRIRAGEAPEHLPGRALPHGGARGSVDGLSDVNDVWSVRMRPGRTYRIAFASTPCAQLSIRRASKTLRRFSCRGYTSFTPGPDGGGRYAVEVRASGYSGRQRYRLQVVAAGTDDIGVGLELAAGSIHRGKLSPSGVDVLDLYHFDVARLSEVRLDLARGAGRSFSLVLLTDTGQRIATGQTGVRRRLGRGRYVVAVEAPPGTEAGRYRLALRLRDVTSTTVLVSGSRSAEVTPGSVVSISCSVSPATTGGRIELQIDRFDPLTGWHFHRKIRIPAGSALSWRPPTAGRWRVRARFLGTRGSAPSRSGYAQIVVARPIG
jgi:hypothetical protein